MPVTEEYLKTLAPIYHDILGAFPKFDSTRKVGYGLSYQSLYSALENLDKKYTFGQIKLACEQMARGGAVEIKNEIFVHPTALGEELIAAITGKHAALETVPLFTPPPGSDTDDAFNGPP
jgi:hypothetical protein